MHKNVTVGDADFNTQKNTWLVFSAINVKYKYFKQYIPHSCVTSNK